MKKSTDITNCNKILIITGGYIDEEFLRSLVMKENYSFIIVADRGLLVADNLKLVPDYILGDFDSVPLELLSKYKTKSIPIKSYPSIKNKTDTQIALEMALSHSPSEIDIVGATGSRMDHTISNIDILMSALNQGVDARILDTNNRIYLKKKNFVIHKDEQHGDYISLLPFSYQVKGLKLHGFKYPLNDITLTTGSSLGVSNELLDEECTVEFEEGILVVFETKD
jgi:thiamine pyrophosphokinase